MIPLADFQPLPVANINNRGFTERYFSHEVPAILIEEVPYKLRRVTAPVYLKCEVTISLQISC